jgi:hypothetical protein
MLTAQPAVALEPAWAFSDTTALGSRTEPEPGTGLCQAPDPAWAHPVQSAHGVEFSSYL